MTKDILMVQCEKNGYFNDKLLNKQHFYDEELDDLA